MGEEEIIDTETSDQLKNWLQAEEAYAESIVAKVLRTTWDRETDDAFLWSINGCARCGNDLEEGREGFVWACPWGDKERSEYASMRTFCSEECASEAIQEWGLPFKKDLLIGYYTL